MPFVLKNYTSYPHWRGQVWLDIGTSQHSYEVNVFGLNESGERGDELAYFDWRSMDDSLHGNFEYRGQRHRFELTITSGLLWGKLFRCTIDGEPVRIVSLDRAANETGLKEGINRLLRRGE